MRQLYDVTAHLFSEEHQRLREQVKSLKPGQTMHTSTGLISHNTAQLYEFTGSRYPERLRRLVLVSLIAQLEDFLANLLREVAGRTLDPFKNNQAVEYPRGRLLSFASRDELIDHVLGRELRRLTSGGLHEFRKYYRSRLNIDLASLPVSWKDFEEVHERRHLHVHGNGVCDGRYAQRHPASGFRPGDEIPVPHQYLLDALDLFEQFGEALHAKVLQNYGTDERRKIIVEGSKSAGSGTEPLMLIRLDITEAGVNPADDLPQLVVNQHSGSTLEQFLTVLIVEEAVCSLVVAATPEDFKGIMGAVKSQRSYWVRGVHRISKGVASHGW